MERFEAELVPVSHGGHYVEVPAETASAAGVKHGARVRGAVEGVPYRSSLMKYSGVFHLGIRKSVLKEAGVGGGDSVEVTIEPDPDPLPGDEVPDDLAKAIGKRKRTQAAWDGLAPSHRREHVKHVIGAKRPETRARRIAKCIEALEERAAAAEQKKRSKKRKKRG